MQSNSVFLGTFNQLSDEQILIAIRAATGVIGERHTGDAVAENLRNINNDVEDLEVLLGALPTGTSGAPATVVNLPSNNGHAA